MDDAFECEKLMNVYPCRRGLPLDWREEQHGGKCCSKEINAVFTISYT